MKQIAITMELPTERTTFALGEYLGQLAHSNMVIYLYGELGAGKTTLVRGFLHARGYFGKVKSPTYSFVESYVELKFPVYHFDLYRLNKPAELECISIRDYLNDKSIILIEWPEKGRGFIPDPTIKLTMEILEKGRKVNLAAANLLGQTVLDKFEPKQIQKNINER